MDSGLGRVAALDRVAIIDLIRAGIELGSARIRLRTLDLRTLIAGEAGAPIKLDPSQYNLVDRVAYAIPRVAVRLPWRADCLVQAIAAERWLRSAGVPSTIHFGIPKVKSAKFEAHAWLRVGKRIVTGDISGYVPLRSEC